MNTQYNLNSNETKKHFFDKKIRCLSDKFLNNQVKILKIDIEKKKSFFELYDKISKKNEIEAMNDTNKKKKLSNVNSNKSSKDLKTTKKNSKNDYLDTVVSSNYKATTPSAQDEGKNLFFNERLKMISFKNSIISDKDLLSCNPLPNVLTRALEEEKIKISKKDASDGDSDENKIKSNISYHTIEISDSPKTKPNLKEMRTIFKNEQLRKDNKNILFKKDDPIKMVVLFNKIFDKSLGQNLGIQKVKNIKRINLKENNYIDEKLCRMNNSIFFVKSILDFSYSNLILDKYKNSKECNIKKIKINKPEEFIIERHIHTSGQINSMKSTLSNGFKIRHSKSLKTFRTTKSCTNR